MGRYLALADEAVLESMVARGVEPPHDQNDRNDQSPLSQGRPHRLHHGAHTVGFDQDAFEERTSIAQHDGGLKPVWADELAQLCTMPAPTQVTPQRWAIFVNDCARLADAWAGTGEALGWGPYELFGCDGSEPAMDKQGLCWLLNGREVVALTATTATVRTADGRTQTFYRHSTEGRELAWEVET